MTRVKICGLTDPDLVRFAASEGADWIGFNFAPGSPRRVTREAAASLLMQVGRARPVALLVDADDAEVDAVVAVGFPVLQLHGAETPERVAAIRKRTGVEVWKVLGVSARPDLDSAGEYTAADLLLIDAKPPEGATRAGGHGQVFDWTILDGWQPPRPWMLAGGLTPDNVAAAIAATGAPAVDVASGVERVRGLKDRELVRAFLRAAKEA
ncbi:phosphoribosylanthranilate isomerase [Hyphomonas sp.]|uniref:phosphoribosylanthranilate isomerase n=1 Tax=Hyphomonas sp. TaxID=87 RepID=UPI0032EEF427|tara:strand:+ start:1615 stop:2244 length:630 start_codon:yes stop_codon:yes gene_type:complete